MALSKLDRRRFLLGSASMGAMALTPGIAKATSPKSILANNITIDTHGHPGIMLNRPGVFDDAEESGITAITASAAADSPARLHGSKTNFRATQPGELYGHTRDLIDNARDVLEDRNTLIAKSIKEILSAKKNKKMACILAVEGGDFAEGRMEAIEEFYNKGVRLIQPVHDRPNLFGDSQRGTDKGDLTGDGKQFIKELNRLGIVCDVAHMTKKGTQLAAETINDPLILSHALHLNRPSVRMRRFKRVSDHEHQKIVVETGGLLGIWGLRLSSKMLGLVGADSQKAFVLNQFKFLADLYGVDHICLGTDIGGLKGYEGWLDDYSKLTDLAEGLQGVGFKDDEIIKMLGGNFMRVFKKVTEEST